MNFLTFILYNLVGWIIVGIILFVISKIDIKRKFNLIRTVSNDSKYVDSIIYKGKTIKLNLVVENLTPKHFDCRYNNLCSHTLFVNEKPILSMWVIDTLSKKIEIIENKTYNTSDIYKILKIYKKEYNKAWVKQFHEQYNKKYNQSIF
jgi:hypothetical protein